MTSMHLATKTVGELVDLYDSGRLDLSPDFRRQSLKPRRRRSPMSERRLLIQSILNGDYLPVDPIYLHRRADGGGNPAYDVIDGKERLETLLWFVAKGPLATSKGLVDKPGRSREWVGWTDLLKTSSTAFLGTSIQTLEVEANGAELINLFEHVADPGKRLSRGDLRAIKR